MRPVLSVERVSKRFGSGPPVLTDLSFEVASGEIASILGPSGCGKTTILRLVAGFERPDAGSIEFAGRTVSDAGTFVPPEARRMGMVFQDPLLFPHLTVRDNLAFGLADWKAAERRARLAELLRLLDLGGLEDRFPHQLSGGQRQRVSLGRALARRPDLILLDEPFCSLDVALRQQLRVEIFEILRSTGTPTLLVTHDQEEALSVSDRLAVLSHGRVEQWAEPDEVFFRPATRFVASFVGLGTFLPARRTAEGIESELGVHPASGGIAGDEVDLFVRPDYVRIAPAGQGMPARVVGTTFYGCQRISQLALPSGRTLLASFPTWHVPRAPETVDVRLELPAVVTFPREVSITSPTTRAPAAPGRPRPLSS